MKMLAAFNACVVMENSLAGQALALLGGIGLDSKNALIVCDEHIFPALGSRLSKELGCEYVILQNPKADDKNLTILAEYADKNLIAVGSGTINDLCKYASFQAGKDYCVFPTAPSMNGYLSANASITLNRHKKTLPAHLPKAVFCDMGVIANAPKRLILSGLGDSLCRPTAQADWLLSHLVLDTPYTSQPFDLLAPYEKSLFANAAKLGQQDVETVALLMQVLLVSGIGMTLAGGSYPASGGEHLIAHVMEMKHGNGDSYHGEQIGITTLIMAELQEKLLNKGLPSIGVLAEKAITAYFGEALKEAIRAGYQEKYTAFQQVVLTPQKWKVIQDRIKPVMLSSAYLKTILEQAGAFTQPQQIGWNGEALQEAFIHAKYIRNRFTFLDISN